MAQWTSCETDLSSIGFCHLLSTESGIIGTALWEICLFFLMSRKQSCTEKTQVCCFTWYVKRRAPEVKSWQCFPNEGSSTCCKIPKETSSCQIPGLGLWHPPCNWKTLCSSSSHRVECPKAYVLSRTLCAQMQQLTRLWMTAYTVPFLTEEPDCIHTNAASLHKKSHLSATNYKIWSFNSISSFQMHVAT